MPHVQFTPQLQRDFPELEDVQVAAASVAELIGRLDSLHPGLGGYLVDGRGALREHVSVFIGKELVRDREALTDAVEDADDVYIFRAPAAGRG